MIINVKNLLNIRFKNENNYTIIIKINIDILP